MNQTIMLKIRGMHCASCAINIDGNLEDIEGVVSAETSYTASRTRVEFDDAKTGVERLLEAVRRAGYNAEVLT